MTHEADGRGDAAVSALWSAIADDAAAAIELIERHPEVVHVHHPQSGRYPLHHAIRAGRSDVVRALLAAGADPLAAVYPVREATLPRTMATERGHDEIVELLDECLRQRQGTTPLGERLGQAIRSGDDAAVDEILSSEADAATSVDARGDTALHACVEAGNWQLMRRLLEAGAPVDARNRDGVRPLQSALSAHPLTKMHAAMAGILLDHGADINAIDDELLSTPLGWRCRYGDTEAAEFLLSRGADPNGAGAPWARPLAWAERRGHAELASILRAAGGRS